MLDNLIIRPFYINSHYDYQTLSAFYKYAYPQESITSSALRLTDASRPEGHVCQRYFVEQNGVVKAVGGFEHRGEFYYPDKYFLHLIVDPSCQNQGIGSTLYLYTIEELEKLKPIHASILIQMEREQSIRFAEKREFSKVKVKWNIVLNVEACDLKPFTMRVEAVGKDGVEIKQWSQLENDLDRDRKLYDLYVRTTLNAETVDEPRIQSFDKYINEQNQRSGELTFVALHNNQYVGMWQLEKTSANNLFGALLGVDEQYQRHGVGLALAVNSIKYAKANHYLTLAANTAEFNKATLALAEKLGFAHSPADVLYRKHFSNFISGF